VRYEPAQGDIVMMDFQPQTGHEQRGRRPGLVVSNASFHRYTRLAIVCPITNTDRGFPMHVKLDQRTKITGVILCEQVKSLDYGARNAVFLESVPEDILEDVLERIRLSLA
jgi:mRNA interferase MazF